MTDTITGDAPLVTPADLASQTDADTAPKGGGDDSGDVAPKRVRNTTRAGRAAEARAKAATKKTADRKPRATSTAARKSPLVTRLDGAINGLGLAVTVAGGISNNQPVIADGQVIIAHANNVATALDKVAQGDPRVKDALEKLLTAGAYGGLLTAMLPLALGIMGNHGIIPAGLGPLLGAPDQTAATGDPLAGAFGES